MCLLMHLSFSSNTVMTVITVSFATKIPFWPRNPSEHCPETSSHTTQAQRLVLAWSGPYCCRSAPVLAVVCVRMLLTMLFDDEDEEYVSALFQVGDQVLQLKQKPHEGREYDKEKEDRQEHAMKHPGEGAALPSPATGENYDSAFPNVGLIVWQAGFVLGEYLLRTQPLGPWQGQKVLELGCGTGQLGIVLALAGAAVTLTDLAHIVPLTQTNCDLNASRCSITPVCAPFMWGTPVAAIPQAGQQDTRQQQQQEQEQPHSQELAQEQAGVLQPQRQHQQRRQQQQQPWDVIVAADVLYEPQHYKELLDSLQQLCPSPSPQPKPSSGGKPPDDQQQQQQQAAAGRPPPPPVYICYRLRRYAEHSFEAQASACGFSVTEVPVDQLHKDYQCGGYRLIRLDRQ